MDDLKKCCDYLLALSEDERNRELKKLIYDERFPELARLLPSYVWQEFMRAEKIAELKTCLQYQVPLQVVKDLEEPDSDSLLRSITENYQEGDEFWFFHAFPGDTGYALIRQGKILEFEVLEVTT